ncbi:MAG: peptidylprolyl isomerase [Homoserinimonas sp.]|nr:peptidylprolyl isomerase [Homoserinimonas sp.]
MPKTTLPRSPIATATAAVRVLAFLSVALVLAGCQSAPEEETGAACEPTSAGSASQKVQVTGVVPELPTVTFPKGLSTNKTERSVIVEGGGRVAEKGSLVTFGYIAYNATSGETIDSVGYNENAHTQASIDATSLMPGLVKALECSSEGSRIAAVIPPEDAFQDAGQADFGVSADDELVFIIDVIDVAGDRAEGAKQRPQAGMPTVNLNKDGEPTIDVPRTNPPTNLRVATLLRGDGPVVGAGATVTVEYKGVNWATGDIFDESWSRPELVQFATTDVVAGFANALVGQTVGSQVIAVVPPEFGYGADGSPDGTISGTDTLVFVIDILAVS